MTLKSIVQRWFEQPAATAKNILSPDANQGIEVWEEDYLVKKVQNQYNDVPEEIIRNAVKSCYRIFRSPQSAEKMVGYVISRLSSNEV